jgi:putative glutamine amidotransferase
MARPVIGITSYVEPASWNAWRDVPVALVPHAYVRHVQQAGALAVVIPPLGPDAGEADVREVVSRLDGVILAGGVDVEPGRYGQRPHPMVQNARPDRDATELLLARVTAEQDVPVLGVCRGMQVMAVAAGGSLVQHLPDQVGHNGHAPAVASYGQHDVATDSRSRLRQILGEQVTVATHHHQGVADAPGHLPTAWSDDGVVEAFEDPAKLFRVGVQWHPEVGTDPRLFEALVAACRS